jgi:hypothetical protein
LARCARMFAFALFAAAMVYSPRAGAQAALLLEQPYGVYGLLNPTGHNAVYFQRICVKTPVKLRRCRPGELGSVISRYEGIDGYDWVAMPLIPYLYSVERADEVPARVTHHEVALMRRRYREAHFHQIGLDRSGGSWVPDGWKQLIGAAYERRIYAFRFETTAEQDDDLIARLNSEPNRSHFRMLYRNCADFSRTVLDIYFPRTFHRSVFPDLGITTPKQVTTKLVRYARRHPELRLTIFEIPQIPGFRRFSQKNKDIAESFVTTAYAVPITLISPYITGGLFIDYIARGRYQLVPKRVEVLGPDRLDALLEPSTELENPSTTAAAKPGAESLFGAAKPASTSVQSDAGADSSATPSATPAGHGGFSD